MVEGYSKRALPEKLGITSGCRIALVGAPSGYEVLLAPLPENVAIVSKMDADLDLAQVFVMSRHELAEQFPALTKWIKSTGSLWVSWPKGASRVPTDLNENVIREIGLAAGLVDVKVIAVDQTWSGLKFVYRLKDRA